MSGADDDERERAPFSPPMLAAVLEDQEALREAVRAAGVSPGHLRATVREELWTLDYIKGGRKYDPFRDFLEAVREAS